MGRRAVTVELTAEERAELERWVRARTSSQQAALRARIVLRAADGASNAAIARAEGVARRTAQQWRGRFAVERLVGLRDRPHRRPPRLHGPQVQAAIVWLARRPPAEVDGAGRTRWTVRDLARYVGSHPELGLGAPSKSAVGAILRAARLRLDRP
jgi:transposase